jgi:putative spermidine/putrescine transport system substrate-binding protein
MKGRKSRVARLAVFGLLVAALSAVAAGCGGDDDGGSASSELEGLGSSIEEIQELAREEGQVNIVQWPLYAQLMDEFTAATGCKVTLKDAGTSDEMISFMGTGEYDGIVASGNATVRLMETGEVASIDEELIPNYADIQEGLKGQVHNSIDGVAYGVPHGRGYNPLAWRTDEVTTAPNSWSVFWENAADYKGKLSVYDDSIFIADAALWLMSNQPDLNITNPYELDEEQFNAAVDLIKTQLAPNVGEWWALYDKQIQSFANGDSTIGTTWPLQVNLLKADGVPVESVKPNEGSTGWSDTWMVSSKAQNPNCMYLWMNHMASPEAQAAVAEGFGEAPANPKACALTKNPNHCEEQHAEDEAFWEDIYYWTTPVADCGDDRGEVCKTQEDWEAAWTEIRG